MTIRTIERLDATIQRLGLVLSPDGDATEVCGVLNPAAARTRGGELRLFPRAVAEGNISRVGRVRLFENGSFDAQRDGFALQPQAAYELRPTPGYGCEDPRVTFIPVLDRFVMAYTAFGPLGPRIAIAVSPDCEVWERVGLVHFDKPGMHIGDDKDAVFFPEPVRSPEGVQSLAFFHRPMLHISALDGRAAIPVIERLPFEDRESIRIAYVPLEPVKKNLEAILDVHESVQVMCPNDDWGSIKIGAGTPPVRIAEGWMSLFHGVDLVDNSGAKPKFRYSAGLMICDYSQPHHVVYRSPKPLLTPESEHERSGIVDNVVFPTGIDPRADLGERTYDVYYGMADYTIGAARLTLE